MKNTDNKFVVFDVETPNNKNNSICAIGVVVINADTCTIIDKFYSLVNPEADFLAVNISINNITPDMVKDSPTFPDIWEKIGNLFENSIVIAHNANFDINVIKKLLAHYNIDCKPIYTICTFSVAKNMLSLSNYKLTTLANHFDIELDNHHNALADTEACANVFLELLKIDKNLIDVFLKTYDMCIDEEISEKKKSYFNNKRLSPTNQSLKDFREIITEISCDGVLSDSEISFLTKWLEDNKHLEGNFPFDRIYISLASVLADGIVTSSEQEYLLSIFKTAINPLENCYCGSGDFSINSFSNKNICLTGEFSSGSRTEILTIFQNFGAIIQKGVTKKTDFIVVGSNGSEAYNNGNYGSKVKKALEMQNSGCNIKIIKEEDIIELLEGVLC